MPGAKELTIPPSLLLATPQHLRGVQLFSLQVKSTHFDKHYIDRHNFAKLLMSGSTFGIKTNKSKTTVNLIGPSLVFMVQWMSFFSYTKYLNGKKKLVCLYARMLFAFDCLL